MATFDQLSAEQRAIIELVLKQSQRYEQLATMLGLPVSRVRELAREALVRLSPVSAAAVDDEWRGQLAEYLLNQQNGTEATATKGHLRRSEAARGWARSVLDSLDQLYDPANLPTIPEG
ncbi:MAG: sigma factor-like helix-turn-helix DNA-binding protein, partial [Thermoleophilaceae bacterium]